jgi:hypothetical protein
MAPVVPPDPKIAEPRALVRLVRALLGDPAQGQTAPASHQDLFDALDSLKESYPNSKPSGDGREQFDEFMKIILGRVRWQARIANAKELVALLGAAGGVVILLGFAWQQFVG